MSKEFEELVLKKLDDTDRMIQDVVLKKLDNTDRMIQDVVLKKLDNNERIIQDVVLKKLDDNEKNIQELSAEFKNLNNKFTVFDYEINRKIDSLFDAFVVNTEKDLVHEEEIVALEEKFFNHDIRISNLENKILTA